MLHADPRLLRRVPSQPPSKSCSSLTHTLFCSVLGNTTNMSAGGRRQFWRPGDSKPHARTPERTGRIAGSKKRRHAEMQSSDGASQNSSGASGARTELSHNIKGMRFMARHLEAKKALARERQRQKELRAHQWTVGVAAHQKKQPGKKGLTIIRDATSSSMGPQSRYSRKSFQGFNTIVEQHADMLRRDAKAEALARECEENGIGVEELVSRFGHRVNRGEKRKAPRGVGGDRSRARLAMSTNIAQSKKRKKGSKSKKRTVDRTVNLNLHPSHSETRLISFHN